MRSVSHNPMVRCEDVVADFSDDSLHRFSLHIPFGGLEHLKTLCVVGQNPSDAGKFIADKTIRYLEELIQHWGYPYGAIRVLNLYTRIDKYKTALEGLDHGDWRAPIVDAIAKNDDFLMFYGSLGNEGAYRFPERARVLAGLLARKNTYKLGINPQTKYPPHPGNPRIMYSNLDVGLAAYNFEDQKS